MRTRRIRLFRMALVIVALGVGIACNVFTTIDRCSSDADCPQGTTCDPEGRFCLKVVGPETGPDVVTIPEAGPDVRPDAAEAGDAGPCNLAQDFRDPKLVKGLEDTAVLSARFASSETAVLLALVDGPSSGIDIDLFQASLVDGGFGTPTLIPNVNAPGTAEYWPTLSADLKLMFFESSRSLTKVDGSYVDDQARIWTATRDSIPGSFGEPGIDPQFKLDSGAPPESSPYLHPSGLSLYFMSYARNDGGGADIYVAKTSALGIVNTIEPVTPVNSGLTELAPVITLDDRTLYFARDESGGSSRRDMWFATRSAAGGTFGAPTRMSLSTTDYDELPSWVSDDHCRFYFISDRPTGRDAGADASLEGSFRLWVASRPKN